MSRLPKDELNKLANLRREHELLDLELLQSQTRNKILTETLAKAKAKRLALKQEVKLKDQILQGAMSKLELTKQLVIQSKDKQRNLEVAIKEAKSKREALVAANRKELNDERSKFETMKKKHETNVVERLSKLPNYAAWIADEKKYQELYQKYKETSAQQKAREEKMEAIKKAKKKLEKLREQIEENRNDGAVEESGEADAELFARSSSPNFDQDMNIAGNMSDDLRSTGFTNDGYFSGGAVSDTDQDKDDDAESQRANGFLNERYFSDAGGVSDSDMQMENVEDTRRSGFMSDPYLPNAGGFSDSDEPTSNKGGSMSGRSTKTPQTPVSLSPPPRRQRNSFLSPQSRNPSAEAFETEDDHQRAGSEDGFSMRGSRESLHQRSSNFGDFRGKMSGSMSGRSTKSPQTLASRSPSPRRQINSFHSTPSRNLSAEAFETEDDHERAGSEDGFSMRGSRESLHQRSSNFGDFRGNMSDNQRSAGGSMNDLFYSDSGAVSDSVEQNARNSDPNLCDSKTPSNMQFKMPMPPPARQKKNYLVPPRSRRSDESEDDSADDNANRATSPKIRRLSSGPTLFQSGNSVSDLRQGNAGGAVGNPDRRRRNTISVTDFDLFNFGSEDDDRRF